MKCAFYQKEITPPLGSPIPGYFSLREGSGVKDRLYVKAAVIDGGEPMVIVIADSCFMPNDIRDAVAKRIMEYTGIKNSNICVGANHSHTGIPIEEKIFQAKGDSVFTDLFIRLAADCAILAYRQLEKCSVTYGCGNVEGISFNRNYNMKNQTPKTNPGRLNPDIEGPCKEIDTSLPVMFFKNESGKPMGAIINFACHQDCVDGTEFSGDYSSALAKKMRLIYGDDFVSLFMLGACGDINHFDVTRASDAPDHYVQMGNKIAGEAEKIIAFALPLEKDITKAEYKSIKIDRIHISDKDIESARHTVNTVKVQEGVKIAADGTDPLQYERAMADRLLTFLDNTPTVYEVPLQVLWIGEVALYVMPGEIFSRFADDLKRMSPFDKCMVATQCNAAVGYVPTPDMYYPGIYEAQPGSNQLIPEAGDMMVDALLKMGKEI